MRASTLSARVALDRIFAESEVELVLEHTVSGAVEEAWAERHRAVTQGLRVAQLHVAALEAEREAERLAKYERAVEAEELKVKLELELWEVSRQLQERKRSACSPPSFACVPSRPLSPPAPPLPTVWSRSCWLAACGRTS